MLKCDTENHRVNYFVLKTMGPVKDRYLIVDVRDEFDKQSGKAMDILKAVRENLVPRQNKYVRMTDVSASYDLVRITLNRTHVVNTVEAYPEGNIQAFIANIIQKDQLHLTLKGLREMMEKDVY